MKNLKEIRKNKFKTQVQVANDLHFAPTTYTAYENGRIQPSTESIIKIADYFNVSIDELVGRDADVINLNYLDETRKSIIKSVLNSSDYIVAKFEAYVEGLKAAEKEREEIMQKLKGKYKND